MDSEEFYDSLDEDSNYGSIGSSEETLTGIHPTTTRTTSRIPVKINKSCYRKQKELNIQEKDDIIPFYDQSLHRSNIGVETLFTQHSYSKDGSKRKFKTHSNKKKSYASIENRKFKSNSYLDIFYARTGMEEINLSSRATCADLSPKSCNTNEDLDEVSVLNFSETESVYSSCDANNEMSLSVASLESKLCSASQVDEPSFRLLKPNTRYTGKSVTQVPMLGSLGPDIPKDKLELFKRRLDYGRKASQKNKIKMMEMKLLSNLQKEIQECKNVV